MRQLTLVSDNEVKLSYINIKKRAVGNTFDNFLNDQKDLFVSPNQTGRRLKWVDVATILDLRSDILNKAIAGRQKIAKRDFVIALCVILRMDAINSSVALYLYDQDILNIADGRDSKIIEYLNSKCLTDEEKKRKDNLCAPELKDFDDYLKANGEINLLFGKRKRIDDVEQNYKISKTVEQIYDSMFDPYNSLETEYDPRKYSAKADAFLYNTKDETEVYLLQVYKSYEWNKGHRYKYRLSRVLTDSIQLIKEDDSLSVSKELKKFSSYFVSLRGEIHQIVANSIRCLGDTKNYNNRVGARLVDGSIHVYAEQFNTNCPELNEYYLVEKIDDNYYYYVTHQSIFMEKNLDQSVFNKYYDSQDKDIKKYDNLNSIEEEPQLTVLSLKKQRQRFLLGLKEKVDTLFLDIIERRAFIRDFESIYDNEADVISYYHLEDNYNMKVYYEKPCEIEHSIFPNASSDVSDEMQNGNLHSDNNYGDERVIYDNEAIFEINNKKVTVSVSMLVRAFELGFSNITEILQCIVNGKGAILT